jgi:hypothetical protein
MKALDIIKSMPIDEKFKIEIINRYDFLTPSQKFAIDSLAWTTFYDIYDATLQSNLELQYQNVKEGKDHFGEDFYARALKKTDKQMMDEFEKSLNEANISIAKITIKQIMDEINASKQEA